MRGGCAPRIDAQLVRATVRRSRTAAPQAACSTRTPWQKTPRLECAATTTRGGLLGSTTRRAGEHVHRWKLVDPQVRQRIYPVREDGRMAEEQERFDRFVESVREFRDDRDWAQFHDPKSLILALVGEVGSWRSSSSGCRRTRPPSSSPWQGESNVRERRSRTSSSTSSVWRTLWASICSAPPRRSWLLLVSVFPSPTLRGIAPPKD